MKKVFTAKTLDECLEMAASQLKIKLEDLNYEILENKKGLFSKKASISVEIEGDTEVTESDGNEGKLNGTVRVQEGKIIVTNPKDGGKPAAIRPSKEVKIMVDGAEISARTELFESSLIDIIFQENLAERRMNISISPDNMKAYISIKYIPQNIYIIKDTDENKELDPEVRIKEQIYPNVYAKEEIIFELNSKGIRYGLKEDNLLKVLNREDVDNVLIAEGMEPIQGIDDIVEIKFNYEDNKKFAEDKEGRVDYKSIGKVLSSKKGDILAIRKAGQDGKDGIDIKGAVKKHRVAKKVELKAGEGCELQDENTIVASIEGKPSFKGNVFSVHQLHIVEKDVDIKTGNIEFVGDVIIYGGVKEGMKVNSFHDLHINKNVESAAITSKGDMEILGNIINSNVSAGGTNIGKLNKIKFLDKLHSHVAELIVTVDHIKKFNLLGKTVHDGEVIKVLLENKFKGITHLCNDFIASVSQEDTHEEKKLTSIFRDKLIGFAPLSIKNSQELNDLNNQIEYVKSKLQVGVDAPVSIKLAYCQDSIISSSGSIIVTGKGEYVSQLTAHENIEFISPSSVVRGGVIKARNEIKCKHVGSEGGVSTKLIVEAKGNIWVDVAYQNTSFIIGGKEYILETASKEVHAYLNNEGELIVDKFVL